MPSSRGKGEYDSRQTTHARCVTEGDGSRERGRGGKEREAA